MNLRLIFISLSCILSLGSCISEDEIILKSDPLLAQIDSILSAQKTGLLKKPITKTATINQKTEKETLTVDSAFIQSEFKTVLSKKYEQVFTNGGYIKNISKNKASYTRKKSENAGPVSLEIIMNQSIIQQISLVEKRDNFLYETETLISLHLDSSDQLIESYEIAGHQKIITLDESSYEITGEITN
ncbi:hypothetical protein [Reichenbachiella agariperforans]|uniref:hypothetical protein n=1 Tax=Reichenbachiella agariperforans TaxID=156994 RepID=UPI001C085B8B|nr:hypothetical protein [Reichenbachiella agariperforans]MBU2915935.1 hypothetical protein [Reichenbachiella agariperforans]